MECRKVKGLYFEGEVIDTDTIDGGMTDTVTIRVDHEYLQDLNTCNLNPTPSVFHLSANSYLEDLW